MNTMKRVISTIAGTAVLLVLATGCTTTTGTAQSTATAGGAPVEVKIWHYWDGANADAFDALVQKYNDSQNAVRVTTSNVPNADFLTKLKTSASSKSLPDIAIGDLVWVPQMAQIGDLADLAPLVDSAVIADVNPALREYGSIEGKQVSLPVSANNLAYMYNRDVFTRAGLDPDNPPKTWEELAKQGAVITEKTGLPGYDLLTEAKDNGEGLTWNFQVTLWQAGGEFLTKDNSAAAFNTAEGLKAVEFWKSLIDSGVSRHAGWGEFEKGAGGSAQEGSWMVGIWAPDPPFTFDVAPLPIPEGGVQATNLGGEQAVVFNNSADKAKGAAEFLEWFLQDEQVMNWSTTTGMLPVTQSMASSDKYLSWVKENEPRLMPYIEQMKYARTRPNTPLYPKISYAFAKEMEKAFAGEVTPQEALNNAERAVNDVIANG